MPIQLLLPEYISCEHCNTKLKLNDEERSQLQDFACPHCNNQISANTHYYETWKPTQAQKEERHARLELSLLDVMKKLDSLKMDNHQSMLMKAVFIPFFYAHLQMLHLIFVDGMSCAKVQFDSFNNDMISTKIKDSLIIPGVLSTTLVELSDEGLVMLKEGIIELLGIEQSLFDKTGESILNSSGGIPLVYATYFLQENEETIPMILNTPLSESKVKPDIVSFLTLATIHKKLIEDTLKGIE